MTLFLCFMGLCWMKISLNGHKKKLRRNMTLETEENNLFPKIFSYFCVCMYPPLFIPSSFCSSLAFVPVWFFTKRLVGKTSGSDWETQDAELSSDSLMSFSSEARETHKDVTHTQKHKHGRRPCGLQLRGGLSAHRPHCVYKDFYSGKDKLFSVVYNSDCKPAPSFSILNRLL